MAISFFGSLRHFYVRTKTLGGVASRCNKGFGSNQHSWPKNYALTNRLFKSNIIKFSPFCTQIPHRSKTC